MTTTLAPWQERFLVPRLTVPRAAARVPQRCVHTTNETGTTEVWAWDEATGERRQVTNRPNGTSTAVIDPTGEWIWWFADANGDEFGVWMRQPFGGGPDEVAVPNLEPSYSTGIAFGRSGAVVIGESTDDGTTVHVAWPGTDRPPAVIYRHPQAANVIAVSADESLVVLNHSEHGDYARPALRALSMDGAVVGELWDGPGRGLFGLGFPDVVGDNRLLVMHERHERLQPLLWNPPGEAVELSVDLPGDLGAAWYPDGSAVLLRHDHRGRSSLLRMPVPDGALAPVGPDGGVISDGTFHGTGEIGAAETRPDGSVWFSWSSSEHPWQLREPGGPLALRAESRPAPPSVPVEDVDAVGPGGPVHALLQRPAGSAAPHPTVFLVHGGPTWHDRDEFNPMSAAWVDAGFAVVRVNYRGSTGYGPAWRDALIGRVGLTELEDIAAVRDKLVGDGIADPDRLVIAGGSWGGFLTLLALGRQPDQWAAGCAAVPVADVIVAYEDEMEPLRAYDRSLFGGSPTEVPERYAESSPINYIDQVRAPVLILAGVNDPRCPIRQIENYIAALGERGKPHEVYRFEAGHGSLVARERMQQIGAMVDFARRTLGLA